MYELLSTVQCIMTHEAYLTNARPVRDRKTRSAIEKKCASDIVAAWALAVEMRQTTVPPKPAPHPRKASSDRWAQRRIRAHYNAILATPTYDAYAKYRGGFVTIFTALGVSAATAEDVVDEYLLKGMVNKR